MRLEYGVMLTSHCPEFESRWTHEYENVQIRVWSWKHRAICEANFTHKDLSNLSSCSMACSDEATIRKKKAAAL